MKPLRILMLIVVLVTTGWQATVWGASLADSGRRVFDYAGLFNAQTAAALEQKAQGLTLQYLQDIVIVTIDDAQGKSSMAFADDFYDYNGFGIGPDYNGLLLLIDMDNREFYITTTGSAIKAFNDAKIETMLDNIFPHVSKGNYAGGVEAFLRDIDRYLGKAGKPGAARYWSWDFFGIGLFVVIMIMGVMIVRHKRGLLAIPSARTYINDPACTLGDCKDVFLHTNTRRIYIDRDSDSGGSSTHTSSSGSSHGGGGRSF